MYSSQTAHVVTQGASSPGVIATFPAGTYPNHTAMINGVAPALHGVVSNTPVDPFNVVSDYMSGR